MPPTIKQSGDWGTLVRRIKKRKSGIGIDWKTIVRRIKTGKCTPIISYQVSGNHFSKQDQVVESWAKELDYPLQDRHDLYHVAQFASVNSRDSLSAKEDYLDFLKKRLVNKARSEFPASQKAFLNTLEDELYDLTFSQVATRLGHPKYETDQENPLRLLAELPMPIYLTTNYATFLEDALKAAGKEPLTEFCYWHDDLRDDAVSVFQTDPDYHPTVERPLVFHLHGLDAHPSSLVLTEDDYLEFLIKISEDANAIPRRISQALADSSLLLLGYQLNGWDFKTIFRGLITSKRSSRRLLSLSIQYELEERDISNTADVQEYLQKYFQKANFDVYWGDTQSFMQELWEYWENNA